MKSRKKDKGKRPGKARDKGSSPEADPKLFEPKFVSHAPKPINPVGGGGHVRRPSRDPHRTFMANEPMRDSHFFPNHLRPRLELAITDASNDFPLVAQTRQRVGKIISHVGQSVCVAARNGLLRPDLALLALQDLLDCLSDYYYEHSYSNRESYGRKLKRVIKASEEWRGFLKELAELAESRKLGTGQESELKPKGTATIKADKRRAGSPAPRQDEPALPQPADITDGVNRTETERRAVINAFILKVEESGRKITRKDIWTMANYKDATEFERFQRGHIRTTKSATDNFNRVLSMNPENFIQSLEKKLAQK